MLRSLPLLVILVVAAPAFADPIAEARSLEDDFARAVNSGVVAAAVDCYAPDAYVIYPSAGAVAHGKPEIENLVKGIMEALKGTKISLKALSVVPLDEAHLATVGEWDQTVPGKPPVRVRTSEVLVKLGGKWRYLVDHASVGLEAQPAEAAAKPAPRRRERRER